jgi:tRNA U34 2-thiouridine synthase MnmA/TrmU
LGALVFDAFLTPLNMTTQRKAVALISGGLDSMLAAKIILDQGIHVEGVNFFTGFCIAGHTHAIRTRDRNKAMRNHALWIADQLGIKLHIIDIIEEYKHVVLHPKHGYGAHLNPCLDCKGFMVRKAREWMEQHCFDFIITGEVVGQRPKSQLKHKLPIIARESGAHDRLLRPLSAQVLEPTLPERAGWVDREKLGRITGRSRKAQIAMADLYGLRGYSQPAGGCCFLTDSSYAAKLRDLWRMRGERRYEFDDILLLKVGRHLRPRPHFKLIVARDAGENRLLHGFSERFTHLYTDSHPGPLALVDGSTDRDELELAARITARFGQGRAAQRVRVKVTQGSHPGKGRATRQWR